VYILLINNGERSVPDLIGRDFVKKGGENIHDKITKETYNSYCDRSSLT
jgi:hypothetical protein